MAGGSGDLFRFASRVSSLRTVSSRFCPIRLFSRRLVSSPILFLLSGRGAFEGHHMGISCPCVFFPQIFLAPMSIGIDLNSFEREKTILFLLRTPARLSGEGRG